MNKLIIIALLALIVTSCNNTVKTEQDLQQQRDSMDAAQRIKDSLEVEAKMLQEMESDTSGSN